MKLYEAVSAVTYTLTKLIPKRPNRWIFGAWFGTAVSDNSKSFYDYISKTYTNIEIIWVVNNPENTNLSGCKVVKRNSLESLKYILTASVAVVNQGFGDFCVVNLLGGCYKVQLWHGIAWKKILKDAMPKLNKAYSRLYAYINHYDLYIAPSEIYKKTVKSAFGAKENQVLLCGQPRNQALFEKSFCAESKKYMLDAIHEKEKKIIVYMPTFRDKTNEVFSFFQNDIVYRLSSLAEKYNFVVIEKSHYKSTERLGSFGSKYKQFIYVMPNMDAQILLAAADVLITDYSSCFFDYLIRNNPIIHYAYDYDYYKKKDRGLYYDIDNVAAGSVAYNLNELVDAIDNNLVNPGLEQRKRDYVQKKYVTYESGDSSKIIMNHICKNIKLEI